MAIDPNEQYVLKGSQIQDMAVRLAQAEEVVSNEDWAELFESETEDVNGVGL